MSGEVLPTCKPPIQVAATPGAPTDWQQATLGDIIILEYGRSLPDKVRRSGAVPVYGSNGVVGWHDEPLVPSAGIVVGRKGTAGSVTVSSGSFWPIDTTYFVKARQVVDWDWLAATLHHARLNELNEATGVPGLNRDKAYRQPVLLPPLDEQRRIAEVLRSVDEAIAAAQRTLDFCENLLIKKRRATFQQLIAEADDDAIRLGDICELGRGFAFKSEDYADEGVLNFRVTNVGKPVSDLGEQRFLPPNFMEEYEEYLLTGGEIVLVMVGATVGKLGRVPHAVCPALLNQNMWTLTAKKPFDQELLWHLAHVLIEEKVHGAQGGAYSFLTKKDFLEHRIGRFDVAEIVEAVSNLSAMEEYSQRLSDEVRQFHHLKVSLMSDLLSGHVRVPA